MTTIATAETSRLDEIVNHSRDLFSLPNVVVEVLDLTSRPHVDARELAACIERDPAMVVKILRVVNSSLFGLTSRVSDLNQAIALLGIKPLKLLVLGFSLPDELFSGVAGDVLMRYWRHTLTRAVAAREIGERMKLPSSDEAFIIGLLQDLGMLVLIQGLGEPYAAFLRRLFASQVNVAAAERRSLGFDHLEVTARLLVQWGLPPSIVETIRGVSGGAARSEAPPAALEEALRLADLLATLLADERCEALDELVSAARGEAGADATWLAELVETVDERVTQLADVLSIELPRDRTFLNILAEAHARLAEVAAEAAGDVIRSQSETLAARLDEVMLLDEVRSLGAAIDGWKPRTAKSDAAIQAAHAAAPTAEPAGARPHRAAPSATRAAAGTKKRPHAPPALVPPIEVSHAEFMSRLSAAVTSCRQRRVALSLLLVELHHTGAETHGAPADDEIRAVERAFRAIEHSQAETVCTAARRMAIILHDCDRWQAVERAGELLQIARAAPAGNASRTSVLSVGAATVALAPRNFPPQDLVASADRCLNAARLSGGNCLKSIEIY